MTEFEFVLQIEGLGNRFWTKVKTQEGCWKWLGAKASFGYGKLGFHKPYRKHIDAHRISWIIHHGDIGNFRVLHRCDNPECTNPEHLFLGTQLQNMLDMHDKRRGSYGLRHPIKRKLTADQVVEMRLLHREGRTYPELGARYGVAATTVQWAVQRRNWKHVE